MIVAVTSASQTVSGLTVASNKTPGSTGPNVVVLPIIDDFQLPLRFRRRLIDSKEIEYINVSIASFFLFNLLTYVTV